MAKLSSTPYQGSLLVPDATQPEDLFKQFLIPRKTVRIAVSGDVYITKLEKDIIDTPDFQRLRGIRQLGTVQYVYPTAIHTRFDHSLGTLCMADRMIQAIQNNMHSDAEERKIGTEQEILARLYALLHDLTHIPFGHTIEDELRLLKKHDHNPARIIYFLGPESEIGKMLIDQIGKELYDRFMAIYIWNESITFDERTKKDESWTGLQDWKIIKPEDVFIHDLVGNTVCADLLDYIARDNYFCNLGSSMEYRFINFLYLKDDDGKRRVFVRLWKKGKNVPRRDTLTDLVRLLEARYLIAERAYFHHAKIISGCMLGRAVQDMILSGSLSEEQLYRHTDDTLLDKMASSKVPTAARLAKALIGRKLYCNAKEYEWKDFAALQAHDHNQNQANVLDAKFGDSAVRRDLEDSIAAEIGAEPGDVLIYAPPRDMNTKAADMKVQWEGAFRPLRNIEDPIVGPRLKAIVTAHEMLWKLYVITKRNLTESQKSLLKEACELYIVCQDHAKEEKSNQYYSHILETRFLGETRLKLSLNEYKASLSNAVREVSQTTSTHKRVSFDDRCREAIQKHFHSSD